MSKQNNNKNVKKKSKSNYQNNQNKPSKNADSFKKANKQNIKVREMPNLGYSFGDMANFAKFSKLILRDMERNQYQNTFFAKHSKQDVIKFLENPEANEKELRNISKHLFIVSSHYSRLIQYFANMPLFYYVLSPTGTDLSDIASDVKKKKNFTKNYMDLCRFLDNMNFQHEFKKILRVIFREDIFFGYEHTNEDTYFIQQLPSDYCKITSIEDGCYNFHFDFSYFSNNETILKNGYSQEFADKYEAFKKDSGLKWQEINAEKSICVKVNEDFISPILPFVGVLESLYDIVDFKSLKKAKEEINNHKFIKMEIPMLGDDFAIDKDTAEEYYEQLSNVLPENIGLIMSPMEMDGINFPASATESDSVGEAERDYWAAAGVSQLLFNSEKSSTASIGNSIKSDEDIVFSVLRSFERWVNRKIKYESNSNKKFKNGFKFKFLDITIFNQKEYADRILKLAQYGVPVKTMAAASVGYSPIDTVNMSTLENDILNYSDSFIPLSSSHTQSESEGATDEGGSPTKDEDDLTDEGANNRIRDNGSGGDG